MISDLSVEEVLGSVADGFLLLGEDWRIAYVNASGAELLGAGVGELVGRHLLEAFPEGVGSPFHLQYRTAMHERRTVGFSEYFEPLDRWFQVRAVPMRAGLAVAFHDVTEVKRAEQRSAELAEVQGAIRAVATAVAEDEPADVLHDLVCRVSAELVDAHTAWMIRFTDAGYDVLAGTAPARGGYPEVGDERSILPGSEADRVRRTGEPVWSSDDAGGRFKDYGTRAAVLQPVRVSGRVWGALCLDWREPRPPGPERAWIADLCDLVGVALSNAEARAELAVRAATDALTGLANLRTLQASLDERIAAGDPVTLALVDVDHFKAVNDGFGHEAGDAVLRAVAAALLAECGPGDLAARIGGDEFALVLAGREAKGAVALAERVRGTVARSGAREPRVTLSVGVCAWEPGLTREAVQRRADDALYWAKLQGRDTVRAFDAEQMRGVDPERRAVVLRRAQEELAFQAQLLDKVPAAVVCTDLDGIVTHWSQEAERQHGWSAREAVGRSLRQLVVADGEPFGDGLARLRAGLRLSAEAMARDKAGAVFPVDIRAEVLTDEDGTPVGTVGMLLDASDRHAARRTLEAARDHLRTVTASIGDGLLVIGDDGVVADINSAGAGLLGCAASALVGRSAADALYGGSEEAARLGAGPGETLRVENDVFVRANGSPLPVGWTSAPLAGGDARVVIFRDATARREQEERLRREADGLRCAARIRQALDAGRFALVAQPIVDLASGAVTHQELLIRMRDGHALVPPSAFLPAAEEHGLMPDIDAWVLEQGVAEAARGRSVHLNLSAQSIGHPTVLATLRRALASTGADPALVTVELTETALTRDGEGAIVLAERLHALGCRLVLDDFGTGYNSLSRLKGLAVDGLKIDLQFVRDLLEHGGSESVVKAIVTLAADLGVPTVAEGVEDEQTAARLRALGVTAAQGYLFGAPAPLPEPVPFRFGVAAPAQA